MTNEHDAIDAILCELHRARRLHPNWPGDLRHAVAIVTEEAFELLQAANNLEAHGTGTIDHLRTEAVQAGAMVLRLLLDTPGLNGVSPELHKAVTERTYKAAVEELATVRKICTVLEHDNAALRALMASQDADVQRARDENARLMARLQDAVSGLLTAAGKTRPVDQILDPDVGSGGFIVANPPFGTVPA